MSSVWQDRGTPQVRWWSSDGYPYLAYRAGIQPCRYKLLLQGLAKMRKLLLLWLAILLMFLLAVGASIWATPVSAAVAWLSYSDAARTVECTNFTSSTPTAYLRATGLQKSKDYKAKVYDANPANYPLSPLLIWDGVADANGVFDCQIYLPCFPNSTPGEWKAELWKVLPLSIQATHTFTVQASAVPELPDVLAGIGVAGICFGIYWKMRKKRGKRDGPHQRHSCQGIS